MKQLIICLCLFAAIYTYAQTDTTINRVVTVERDFQPVIQSAGKIDQRPIILQPDLQLNPVVYSTYSTPLAVGHNIHPLQVAETKFTPQAPLNGVLEGAVGYRNTHLLFGYQLQKKNNDLNLYANHDAYWGKDAQSQSKIGMNFTHHFNKVDIYFNVEGAQEYWQYKQRISKNNEVSKWFTINELKYRNNIWAANTNIGIVSTYNNPIQYRIQTGYKLLAATPLKTEHQVRSLINLFWSNDTHTAGLNANVQNYLYSTTTSKKDLYITPHHALRIEPFYRYNKNNLLLHVGVNLDLNIDPLIQNIWFTKSDKLSFAPSPNIQLEWHTKNRFFHLYADVKGSYGTAAMEEIFAYNRYVSYKYDDLHAAPYTPIDATLGFKLRPSKTLLINIYGGYAMVFDQFINISNISEYGWKNTMPPITPPDSTHITSAIYELGLSNYQQWKVGGALHYHYRDIVELNINGNYYFFKRTEPLQPGIIEPTDPQQIAYDRPNWNLKARVDVHIDSKWSIYSDNYFAGSRWAYTSEGDKQIKPIISLNIGGQYAINRWLLVYLQLNDYLNRKDEIFYGFQSQGIHFLAGVRWQF